MTQDEGKPAGKCRCERRHCEPAGRWRIQDESGVWYYNVTDVIAALTGTTGCQRLPGSR